MIKVAPSISRSPRQAPGGASPSPVSSAAAAPPTAISTPSVFLAVMRSRPSTAATSIVVRGSIESASEPRAAVVMERDSLYSTKKTAK